MNISDGCTQPKMHNTIYHTRWTVQKVYTEDGEAKGLTNECEINSATLKKDNMIKICFNMMISVMRKESFLLAKGHHVKILL